MEVESNLIEPESILSASVYVSVRHDARTHTHRAPLIPFGKSANLKRFLCLDLGQNTDGVRNLETVYCRV